MNPIAQDKTGNGARKPPRLLMTGSIDDEHNRLLKLYQTYTAAGFDVNFTGMDRMGRRPRRQVINGMKCEYLTSGWGYSNWRLLIGYPVWVLKLLVHSLTVRTDIVHVFELESALPVAVALFFRGIPFIYDVQDNYDLRHNWPFPLKHIIRALDKWVIKRASGIIVPDENRIVGPFKPYRDKITIMPNCPPDVSFSSSAVKTEKVPGTLTVLAMGQLSERRGINLLLDAVSKIPEARVIMAGRFTEPWLEEKAQGMSQVEVHSWLPWEEAIGLGYHADVTFAFYDPSFAVNVLANAQKWFDAMMTGCPILSNREIANAAWIEEEDIGYTCPYGDVAALEKVLRSILENPEEAERKGQSARRLFEQQYNWPLMEKRLLGIVWPILRQEVC